MLTNTKQTKAGHYVTACSKDIAQSSVTSLDLSADLVQWVNSDSHVMTHWLNMIQPFAIQL